MLDSFDIDTFKPRVGDRFDVRLETDEEFVFELDSVDPLPEHRHILPPDGNPVPFSLTFRGPRGIAMPQGTYQFSHDDLGEFDLFIVPIERRGERFIFLAVFN